MRERVLGQRNSWGKGHGGAHSTAGTGDGERSRLRRGSPSKLTPFRPLAGPIEATVKIHRSGRTNPCLLWVSHGLQSGVFLSSWDVLCLVVVLRLWRPDAVQAALSLDVGRPLPLSQGA